MSVPDDRDFDHLFLAEGGEMGMQMRQKNWSAAPLGDPAGWPQSLRTAIGLLIASKFPMFLAWGPELRFFYNDGYAEILADKHPEALGRRFDEIWTDIWAEILPIVERTMAGEASYWENLKLRMQRRGYAEDGWFTFSYSPVRDESGAVAGLFCVVTETTVTVLAQQALRESEERFRLIADSAPVPMWVSKLDRKRAFVNQAYVDFLGLPREQALDWDWRENIHPEDFEQVVAQSIAGEASRKPFALVARYRRADGAWRWLRSESQPRWGTDGELQGFIGVAHDITASQEAEARLREFAGSLERRVEERTAELSAALESLRAEAAERERAEEALRQAQKMEAVGQLTGGIAHDFNNLLTPIMGGLELIAARMTDPRLKRIAETALESSRRGAKLTGQLLAFSRIQRISMAPIDINAVIAGMQDLLRHAAGGGMRIETALDDAAGQGVCDSNQLENAVLNLVINARDAMPDGGTVTISTARQVEEAGGDVDPGEYVRVTVADTGQGMPPDVLARATEPFFSTKPLGKGTGLGLAQVYGIARQSGGTVRIESGPGLGTRVHILLPCSDEAAERGEAEATIGTASPADEGAGGATILVIDDDQEVRGFLATTLEGLGHNVIAAAGGVEGLARLADGGVDLLLVDYAMPEMDGAEVARAARRSAPDLPVIFVTGFAESDRIEAAVGPGAAILRKPFTVSALAAMIGEKLAA